MINKKLGSMDRMRAVVLQNYGKSDQFRDVEINKPEPKTSQVCIKVKAAGFNPVDWKIREGWYGGTPPQILGCDCSGIIEEASLNSQFSKGDEVYAMSFIGTGQGSYAEYVCVPEELVYRKPKNLTFDEAACIPLAAMTAFRAIVANRAFKKGDVVIIAGIGGGVGSFAFQMLKFMGVKKIFTLARSAQSAADIHDRFAIPKDQIIISEGLSSLELKEQILFANEGKLFDATLDLVGGEIKKLCLDLTQHSGHFVTIVPEKSFELPFWGENDSPRAKNLSIHQVNIGSEMSAQDLTRRTVYRDHLEKITSLIEEGVLQAPRVVNVGSLSTQTVQEAHAMLESNEVQGKLIMVIS